MISIQLAYGDVFDKLTILEIKLVRLTSQEAAARVGNELDLLRDQLEFRMPGWRLHQELVRLINDLRSGNGRLWNLENTVRTQLATEGVGLRFAETAGEIFARNEQRARLKRSINLLLESPLCEEKEYAASAASSLGIKLEAVGHLE